MTPTSKPKTKVAKKLLVVEDEGQIGLVLNMILSERNFDLDYVSSLLSAQEYLERNKPSLVILDNKLPDGFGVDFISYIKKKYPAIKIIMISGFSTARDVALENGADMFLEKPFSMDDVNEAIDTVLAKSEN
jgi:two-component system OmpR family response regulator